jgi:hypothetical protein
MEDPDVPDQPMHEDALSIDSASAVGFRPISATFTFPIPETVLKCQEQYDIDQYCHDVLPHDHASCGFM